MRARLTAMFIVVLLVPVMAMDGEELMRRHREAVTTGSNGVDRLSNLRMTGAVDKYGLHGNVGIFADLPDRFAVATQFSFFKEDVVLRGKSGEILDATDRPRELDTSELADFKTLNFMLTYQYLRSGQMLPTLVREDGAVYTSSLTGPDGLAISFQVDSKTFLLKGFSFVDSGGQERRYSIDEYRDVDGYRLPVRMQVQGDNPAVFTFNLWEVNRGVDGALFNIPAKPAPIGLPDKGAVRLPIQVYFELPLVKAWIGNSPALTFLLDLGLPYSIIDQSIATQLGLAPAGQIRRSTRYLGSEFSLVRIPSLLLREVEFKDRVFLVTNMIPPSANVQLPIHGVIGNDLFTQDVVQLDMAAEQLRLFSPKAFSPGGDAKKIMLQYQDERLMVPASVDGVDSWLELTSACGDSVMFAANSPTAQALAQRTTAGMDGVSLGLMYGIPERILRIGALSLDGLVIPSPLAHLVQFPADNPLSRRPAGWLGTGILRRFTVSLDFTQNALYLEPPANPAGPDCYNATGLYVIKNGGEVIVQQVIKGSPADKAGIMPGDKLAGIHGYPAEQVLFDRLYEFLCLNNGDSVKLKIRHEGTDREITLTRETKF
jgi:hypothetical protein